MRDEESEREGCEGNSRTGCDSVSTVNNLHVTVNLRLCGGGHRCGGNGSEACEKMVAVVRDSLRASKIQSSVVVDCTGCSKGGSHL